MIEAICTYRGARYKIIYNVTRRIVCEDVGVGVIYDPQIHEVWVQANKVTKSGMTLVWEDLELTDELRHKAHLAVMQHLAKLLEKEDSKKFFTN